MRRMNRPLALGLALFGSGALLAPSSSVRHLTAPAADYGKLALSFEPNRGQSARGTEFVARGEGYSIGLARGTVKLRVRDSGVDLSFPGSRSTAPAEALEPRPGRVNYFIGNDPSKWLTNLPTYARVRYRDLYPGVDLVLYGNQRQLEYDLIARPGVDVGAIALRVDGAERLDLDPSGELLIALSGGTSIRQHRPDIYQVAHGQRRSIEGGYRLTGEHTVAFWTGAYDRELPITIDPVIVYSSAFGGRGEFGDHVAAIAVDGQGNTYVAGRTDSDDFPVSRGAWQSLLKTAGRYDWNAFVAKVDASGSNLEYATYLGGNNIRSHESNSEGALGLAIDGAGNAYITGSTDSTDFPTVNAFQPRMQNDINDGQDGFVTKLNGTGSALIFSTYLGGRNGWSLGAGIVVDSLGNAYVGGATNASQFPATPIGPGTGRGGFVIKFNPAGSVVYSTSLPAGVNSIAVDQVGQVLAAGSTNGPANFPVVNGSTASCLRTSFCLVGFLAKLSASGSQWVYSTLLGGEAEPDAVRTHATSVAVDPAGNAYVAGYTSSSALRTKNAVQPAFSGGESDAFVSSFTPAGALRYATYLGGTGSETAGGTSVGVDAEGNAYIAGSSASTDFPLKRSIVASHPAGPIFSSAGRDGTWTVAGRGLTSSVNALAFDPLRPGVMYAGTVEGVFKSRDAGQTWSAANNGITSNRIDFFITSIAIDPRTPETLYAGTRGGLVFKSVDAGGRWDRVIDVGHSPVIAVDPVAPNVVYAGGSGLYTTIDGGRTWTLTHSGIVRAVAVDGSAQGIVYLIADRVNSLASLYQSSNRGSSWTLVNMPGFESIYRPTALTIDPDDAQVLYVGWFDFDTKRPNGLIKSVDGGAHWTSVFDRGVTAMVFAPRRQEMYVSTVPREPGEPCVWRSRDAGHTWVPAIEGLYSGASTCETHTLAVDPIRPTVLYAGAELRDVAYLTRLTPGGAVSYATYLPVSFLTLAAAADLVGNAYLAGATPVIQPWLAYKGRPLVMKVAPDPASSVCGPGRADDERCSTPTRVIRPRGIDRR